MYKKYKQSINYTSLAHCNKLQGCASNLVDRVTRNATATQHQPAAGQRKRGIRSHGL